MKTRYFPSRTIGFVGHFGSSCCAAKSVGAARPVVKREFDHHVSKLVRMDIWRCFLGSEVKWQNYSSLNQFRSSMTWCRQMKNYSSSTSSGSNAATQQRRTTGPGCPELMGIPYLNVVSPCKSNSKPTMYCIVIISISIVIWGMVYSRNLSGSPQNWKKGSSSDQLRLAQTCPNSLDLRSPRRFVNP